VILPSLATIFLCSFLLAASVLALAGMAALYRHIGSLYTAEAFFRATPGTGEVDSLERVVLQIPGVSSAEFIDPDLAMQDFKTHFGESMLSLVRENPLPASFRVSLSKDFWHPDSLQKVEHSLAQMGGIDQVRTSLALAQKAERYRLPFLLWPSVVALLMLGFVWLIVGNAVRLTLLSRRELVENMKYAGASYNFIEFPFVLEGALQGLLASVLASIVLLALVVFASASFPILQGLLWRGVGVSLFCAALVALCGAFSSYRSVRRFLR
jgi:cell division transport system permease protein